MPTWGETLEITANNNQLEQSNIRFQGQYYDEETGLHYNRYRYYEPYSARYVSKDPIGLEGGLNHLSYVSDPNQWIDPMGLERTGLGLGFLLPNTMAPFSKSSNTTKTLQQLGAIRNNNLKAVAVSGYAPYVIAAGAPAIRATTQGYGALNSVAQTALKGGATSTGIDGSVQAFNSYRCKCNAFDMRQSAGAFAGGAIGGVYAGNMIKSANLANNGYKSAKEIVQVGALNLHNNLRNVSGQTIWKQSAVVGAATGQMSKAIFTDGKTVKNPAKGGK